MSSSSSIQRVLVTGGNKGIGFAVCQKLLEEYPNVHVLLGARDVARGQEAVFNLLSAVPESANRVEMIQIDVADKKSVHDAAEKVKSSTGPLYGIVNNAGRGFGLSLEDTLATNFWGARHVCDAFAPLLNTDPNGHGPPRIVNVGSASGPMFVAKLPPGSLKEQLSKPWLIGSLKDLDKIASRSDPPEARGNEYGYSKALLAALTYVLARDHPTWIVNTVTPGFIATDITRGMGATNPPSKGATPIVHCLMSEALVGIPQGRYYGSDAIRSPLDVYRGPGDAAYDGPDGP